MHILTRNDGANEEYYTPIDSSDDNKEKKSFFGVSISIDKNA